MPYGRKPERLICELPEACRSGTDKRSHMVCFGSQDMATVAVPQLGLRFSQPLAQIVFSFGVVLPGLRLNLVTNRTGWMANSRCKSLCEDQSQSCLKSRAVCGFVAVVLTCAFYPASAIGSVCPVIVATLTGLSLLKCRGVPSARVLNWGDPIRLPRNRQQRAASYSWFS